MPRRPPPPHRRGQPKTPGSGRRKGSLNRKTLALRELMTALTGDIDYQRRLRQAFRTRRIHPSIEALVWAYAVGKPVDRLDLSARSALEQKIEGERQQFATLSVGQMEQLAKESDALVAKARAMAAANLGMAASSSSPRRLMNGETVNAQSADPT